MATYNLPVLPQYVSPLQVRRTLGTQLQSSADDDLLMWMCDLASRRIDEFCNRKFYIYRDTMHLDWPGTSFDLDLPEDLHTVVTLTNGDGNVIPATSGGSTVHFLYPTGHYPKYRLQLGINTGYVYLFSGTPQQCISLDGWFGYPAVPNTGQYYISTSATVQDAATGQSATQTTLLTQTGSFQAGQTLLIGSEMEFVQSVVAGQTNDTLTVVRGAVGTTAAIHANDTAISLNIYHGMIVNCAYRLVGYLYRQKDSQLFDTVSVQQFGQLTIPLQMPKDVEMMLKQFIRTH